MIAAHHFRGKWILLLVFAVCVAPVAIAYLTYYVIKPQSRSNYGDLIDPRAHPLPDLGSHALNGQPATLAQWQGKWLLIQVHEAGCDQVCETRLETKLFYLRQLRLMQGRDADRIERVWLITDQAPLDAGLMKKYDGTRLLRVDPVKLAAWLPVKPGMQVSDHLYLIDPLGRLMMRFPANADASQIHKDMTRLLRASRIG